MKLTLVLDNWGHWGPAGGAVLFDDKEAIASAYIDTVEDFREFLDTIDIDEVCDFLVEVKPEDILSGSINDLVKECSGAFKARIGKL